jgi:hypothetical protein
VYSDHALARALDTRSFDGIQPVLAYDSACSYSVNINSRFATNLPHQLDTVKKISFTIDSLHVHDHIDRCMYLYSTNYRDGTGHFHASGCEQFWSEHNQGGPQTRQMTRGGRHDKHIQMIHDWNLKKVVGMGISIL